MPRKRKRNTAPAGQQSQPVKAAEAPRNEMRAITVKEGRREYSSELDQALNRMFGAVVANPDKTLDVHAYRHNATGIELYSEMIRKDAQLKLLFDARALTVLSQGWQIEPASSDSEDVKRAEWVEDKLLQIKHFSMSRKLFFGGISHGYRPAEIMLDVVGGEWVVTEFQNREPYRFGFDREDGLILVRREGRMVREVMPDHKFLMNTWGSDETPYGSAMLKNLYSLWFFKNHALKTFFKFLEKFGTPTLVGEYPPGSSTDDQNALLDILYNMIGSSAVIKPEGTKLEIARTEGVSAISQVFKWAVEVYVDRQFAKMILGQTLSTESESGTHALAKFQSKSQQHIAESDGQWQEEIISEGVVKLLIDLNEGPLPARKYPKYRIPYEEQRDVVTYLTALDIAVNKLGLEVSADHVYDATAIPPPGANDLLLPGAPATAAPNTEGIIDPASAVPDEADGLSESQAAAKFLQRQQGEAWKKLSTQLLSSRKEGKKFVRTYR